MPGKGKRTRTTRDTPSSHSHVNCRIRDARFISCDYLGPTPGTSPSSLVHVTKSGTATASPPAHRRAPHSHYTSHSPHLPKAWRNALNSQGPRTFRGASPLASIPYEGCSTLRRCVPLRPCCVPPSLFVGIVGHERENTPATGYLLVGDLQTYSRTCCAGFVRRPIEFVGVPAIGPSPRRLCALLHGWKDNIGNDDPATRGKMACCHSV
jgi:hypothetical protein